jgi:hypothetical protein
MLRKELSETVAEIAGRPITTIENNLIPKLQSAGLVPAIRGPSGEVDSTYRVNVLLGAIFSVGYGASAGESVKRWRSLPLTSDVGELTAVALARHFGIDTSNAGAALDSILETIRSWSGRSPILEAKAGGDIRVAVEFHGEDCMVVVFHGPAKTVGTLTFGSEPVADTAGRVERIVRLLHRAFERLAQP